MADLTIDEVRAEVKDALLLLSSSNLLIGIETVPKLIPLLRRRRSIVLGLDGFRTDGRKIMPSPYLADFSELESAEESYEALTRVIAAWLAKGGLEFVEITLEWER
jgi:hypothetical protein